MQRTRARAATKPIERRRPPVKEASLARLSPFSQLLIHTGDDASTPQALISRPDLMGQHCDRPPDCSACIVFFLFSASQGTPERECLRGAMVSGPGLWLDTVLVGPLPLRSLDAARSRPWGSIDGIDELEEEEVELNADPPVRVGGGLQRVKVVEQRLLL